MTHKPPLPDAATPPWPATPAPHDSSGENVVATGQEEDPEQAGGMDKRIVAGVAGIAVGSAAIAAALLFSGRLNRPKSASAPLPARTGLNDAVAPGRTRADPEDAPDVDAV